MTSFKNILILSYDTLKMQKSIQLESIVYNLVKAFYIISHIHTNVYFISTLNRFMLILS